MENVLLYSNRKTDGSYVWDVSTPELKEEAFADLFNMLDREWYMFEEYEKMQSKILDDARTGDAKAIKFMLDIIEGSEYGHWYTTKLQLR